MKKKISFIIILIGIFLLSGCSTDSMENITIYTSVYPIEYVTTELYGSYSTINNMYPQGINPYNYKLTNKQIKDYGNSDLVVYNGLGKEKDYIVTMVNNNKKLRIIDSTNRIEYKYSQDEVWINPSNVLMVARNIKEGLKEYVVSENLDKKIDDNYEALKINISNLDVELKEMAENASNKDIIVQDNELTFLTKYNLNIISLDDKTITDKIYNDASNLMDSGDIKYIYILSGREENEHTKKLREEHSDIEILYIDPINNISTEDKNDGKDYISIMNDNIDKLKQELY
jgi:zinc transport system substrate-binding protein